VTAVASQGTSAVAIHSRSGNVDADNAFLPGTSNLGDPAFEKAGTTLFAPSLYNNIWGFDTVLHLTNTGTDWADVTFNFTGRPGYSDITRTLVNFPPNWGYDLYLSSGSVFGTTRWVGSVVVTTSEQPMAAQITHTATDGSTRTYNASAGGGSVLYVPAVYNNWNGFTSGLVVQNVGSASTTATVYFYDRNGALSATHSAGTINSHRAVGIYLPGVSGLPASWVGSARIVSSGQPLVAAVQTDRSTGGRNAFSAVTTPAATMYMPRAAKSAGGYTSSYLLQNAGGSTLQVTATYYDTVGNWAYSRQHTLNAYGAAGNWQGFDPLPDGWQGSIVFTADGPWLVAMFRDEPGNSISGYNGVGR
jgi:hypothetical protein